SILRTCFKDLLAAIASFPNGSGRRAIAIWIPDSRSAVHRHGPKQDFTTQPPAKFIGSPGFCRQSGRTLTFFSRHRLIADLGLTTYSSGLNRPLVKVSPSTNPRNTLPSLSPRF